MYSVLSVLLQVRTSLPGSPLGASVLTGNRERFTVLVDSATAEFLVATAEEIAYLSPFADAFDDGRLAEWRDLPAQDFATFLAAYNDAWAGFLGAHCQPPQPARKALVFKATPRDRICTAPRGGKGLWMSFAIHS